MATGGGQPESQPEPPRPSPFGAFRLTGVLAASLIALVLGVATYAQLSSTGGEGASGPADAYGVDKRQARAKANGICRRVSRQAARRPSTRADATGRNAEVLLKASSDLSYWGATELSSAFTQWATATTQLNRARGADNAARARGAVRAARRDVEAAARELRARRCVRLARRG